MSTTGLVYLCACDSWLSFLRLYCYVYWLLLLLSFLRCHWMVLNHHPFLANRLAVYDYIWVGCSCMRGGVFWCERDLEREVFWKS